MDGCASVRLVGGDNGAGWVGKVMKCPSSSVFADGQIAPFGS